MRPAAARQGNVCIDVGCKDGLFMRKQTRRGGAGQGPGPVQTGIAYPARARLRPFSAFTTTSWTFEARLPILRAQNRKPKKWRGGGQVLNSLA